MAKKRKKTPNLFISNEVHFLYLLVFTNFAFILNQFYLKVAVIINENIKVQMKTYALFIFFNKIQENDS